MKKLLSLVVACSCFSVVSIQAQVYVNETFDYPDTATLLTKWNNSTGLSLDTASGNPAPAGAHSGTATAHTWIGSSFSITPTDASPLILSADLWYSGNNNQRNTVGLRTGTNPLFEMGFYNQAGPPSANGLAVRLLGIGGVGGAWNELASYTALGTGSAAAQWIHLEATFTAKSATVRWDLGVDGIYDGSQTWTGTTDVLPFSDLRFGGPSGVSSTGGGFLVDNIRLEVVSVPEPAAATLLGLGIAGLIGFRRMRKQ
ncbi:MAG TPA: PEP-CTERM sorting domain-containing protein [Verrucomicrobiae bacterium]|nr:PEP-CTERM sorting domain-containing protein [Verrucomicrobiae bacterium]